MREPTVHKPRSVKQKPEPFTTAGGRNAFPIVSYGFLHEKTCSKGVSAQAVSAGSAMRSAMYPKTKTIETTSVKDTCDTGFNRTGPDQSIDTQRF